MRKLILTGLFLAPVTLAQTPEPDWAVAETEALEHFRALLQFDTSDPPVVNCWRLNTYAMCWRQRASR